MLESCQQIIDYSNRKLKFEEKKNKNVERISK